MNRSISLLLGCLIIAGAIGLFLIVGSRSESPPREREERALLVYAESFQKKNHTSNISLLGRIEARNRVQLQAPIDTHVRRVPVVEGERVARGASLLQLDLREIELDLAENDALIDEVAIEQESVENNRANDLTRLDNLRQQMEIAQANFVRDQELLREDVISQSVEEQSKKALLQAQLDVENLRKALQNYDTQQAQLAARANRLTIAARQKRLARERAQIDAPFDGRVIAVNVAAGDWVTRGEPLIELYDTDSFRLLVFVPINYLSQVTQAQSITGVMDDAGAPVTLSVLAQKPEADNSGVVLYFDLDGDEWLLGKTYPIMLQMPTTKKMIAAPKDAFYADLYVYRINDEDRTERIDCVREGVTRVDREIRLLLDCPALQSSDRIIVNKIVNLFDGALVSIVDSASVSQAR